MSLKTVFAISNMKQYTKKTSNKVNEIKPTDSFEFILKITNVIQNLSKPS